MKCAQLQVKIILPNDFLIVDKNLFAESEEIQPQNYFEINVPKDNEDDDK